jgi:predicted nucleotidyltransferase
MRLTIFEVQSIINTFHEVFGNGKIYLFGSRVDESKKGGDIDLYLEVETQENLYEKKIDFLVKLQNKIGEQKIDIVFAKDPSRNIEKEIMGNRMELDIDKIKLEKYFHECDKHIQRIEEAYLYIASKIPLSAKDYIELDKDTVQALDQYIFRFSKLQDTMGDKLFKLIFSFYNDTYESIPFLDLLNTLEKLGYLESAKEWINLRKIRNDIAHQYDDEPEESSKAINNLVIQKEIIIKIYENIKNKYKKELL